MTKLDSLSQALRAAGHFVSSSDINACSVRVHQNPLLSELVVDGRLRSDLEFALQNNDQNALQAIVKSERSIQFGDAALPRHMSPSDYEEAIDAYDGVLHDISDAASAPAPPAAPVPASPASPVPAS